MKPLKSYAIRNKNTGVLLRLSIEPYVGHEMYGEETVGKNHFRLVPTESEPIVWTTKQKEVAEKVIRWMYRKEWESTLAQPYHTLNYEELIVVELETIIKG